MLRRFLNIFRSRRLEAEIREEIEFHRTQSNGSFGNATLIADRMRDASTVAWLESCLQDLRYGLRQLLKSPVLLAVAVLSLSLGIGANTAIFTLINAIMLQLLPFRHRVEACHRVAARVPPLLLIVKQQLRWTA
jgi:hypothetical protein